MNKLISIIIPTYNGAKYIAQTIESIQKQNMNVEIIVIDDISTDNTVEIAKNMGCIVFINDKHKGQVAAKNIGIQKSKGEYWLTIDQDDVLTENALAKLYAALEVDKNTHIVMAKLIDFCSEDTPEKANFVRKKSFYGILTGSTLFKKEVFNTIGYFDESIITGDVIDLTTRLEKASIEINKLDFISCKHRIHNANYGITNQKDEYKDYAKLLRKKITKA